MREWEDWRRPQLCVMLKDGPKDVKGYGIRVHRFLQNGDVKNLYIDIKLPKKTFHTAEFYVWNPGSEQELLIDNMRAELYEEE